MVSIRDKKAWILTGETSVMNETDMLEMWNGSLDIEGESFEVREYLSELYSPIGKYHLFIEWLSQYILD